jgi:uncharacterized protein (TIGR02145 family)
MKNLLILLSVNLFITYNINAQTLKTYKGDKYIDNLSGVEIYNYFENAGEIIKHGNYNFVSEPIDRSEWNYAFYYVVNGKFKNNLSDGIWTLKFVSSLGSDYKVSASGSFLNGIPNGNWIATFEEKLENGQTQVLIYQAAFKNGKFNDNISRTLTKKGYTNPESIHKTTFDEEGYINDEYYYKGFPSSQKTMAAIDRSVKVYYDNSLQKLFVLSDIGSIDWCIEGDVTVSFEDPLYNGAFDNTLFKLITSVSSFPCNIPVTRKWEEDNGEKAKIELNNYTNIGNNEKVLKIEYFINYYFADKALKNKKYSEAISNYKKCLNYSNDTIFQSKIDFAQYDSIISNAENLYNSRYIDKAHALCIEAKSFNKTDERVEIIIKKIEKDKKAAAQLFDNAKTNYSTKKFPESISGLLKVLSLNKEMKSAKELLNTIEQEYKDLLSSANTFFVNCDYTKSLESYMQMLVYIPKDSLANDMISTINKLQDDVNKSDEKIKSSNEMIKPNLKGVYKKVYPSLVSYYDNLLSNEKNIFKKMVIQDRLIELYKRIDNLLINEDKEIQKQLKDAESDEEYASILKLGKIDENSFKNAINDEKLIIESIESKTKPGNFIDFRDGNYYKLIQIGEQTWMAENLAYKHSSRWRSYNISGYGNLYNWEEAKNACPEGWHLPSDVEWTELINYLGGESKAGGMLKEIGTTNWASPNAGATDKTGFTGLPCGGYDIYGASNGVGYFGNWWSSTELDAKIAWGRELSYEDSKAHKLEYIKSYEISVRCLQD